MALECLLDRTGVAVDPADLYAELDWPEPPDGRPYVAVNMVATADGKSLLGPRGSTARGLGTSTDQQLMRRIQQNADGAIIGASTLRAGTVIYAPRMWRAVITGSGDVPLDNRFFTDAPDRAIVFAPRSLSEEAAERLGTHALVRTVGDAAVDVAAATRLLREEFGVRHAVLEGGASLNFEFVAAGLVDELFLTVASKLKGGGGLPTVVDGPGLPDHEYVSLALISLYHDADELYLRYRVGQRERVAGR